MNGMFPEFLTTTFGVTIIVLAATGAATGAPYLGATAGPDTTHSANFLLIDHQRLPGGGDLAAMRFTLAPRDARMTVARKGNVRTGPATEFDVVLQLEAGTEVSITGATEVAGHKWFSIKLDDGTEGYMWASLLRGREGTQPQAAPAPVASGDAGATFSDCPTCPEMVVIRAGDFSMGSSEDEIIYLAEKEGAEPEWISDETPRHDVHIARDFAVGRYEVTQAQYAVFVQNTRHPTGRQCHIYKHGGWHNEASRNWRVPGRSHGDSEPVVCVNWRDATAYAAWLSETTGQAYRLLSEAEWEYAARAGTETRRYWGDDADYSLACQHANVSDLSRARNHQLRQSIDNIFMCEDGIVRRAPVGTFLANPFGLYDMLGNVWEWVEDCYHDDYRGAPSDGSARTRSNCNRRVLRGGSWDFDPRIIRSANRGWGAPHDRSGNVGFRVARDLP